MKVIFTCEKCGVSHPVDTPDDWTPSFTRDTAIGAICPDCAKLTYGLLTEEMLAEAVRETWTDVTEEEDCTNTARFILRLLEKTRGKDLTEPEYQHPFGWRDWLLGLAREPCEKPPPHVPWSNAVDEIDY